MPMRKPMLGKYIAWTRINLVFRCTYSSLARLKHSISKGSWRYARTTRTPDNVSWLALPCGLVRDFGANPAKLEARPSPSLGRARPCPSHWSARDWKDTSGNSRAAWSVAGSRFEN